MGAEKEHDVNDGPNNEQSDRPVVGLPGDERDVLITRVIDGAATSDDWATFRATAAHDPSIWAQLARTQQIHETMCQRVQSELAAADRIELPGGLIDDRPVHARLDMVSRWGGWAAAIAIMVVWIFGQSSPMDISNEHNPVKAGMPGSGILLDQAKPDQAFDQYLSSGQTLGQVIGEMPDRIVIETRPMPDGTIEVLYLRQIIERRVIDHAYREMRDETGNVFPVPVKLSPGTGRAL